MATLSVVAVALVIVAMRSEESGSSANLQPVRSFSFLFYNTENLFDFSDDSGIDDAEFNAGGPRGWNYEKYRHKLNSIAKVILSAGEWEPPALVGLCETENRGVVADLIRLTPLSRYDYDIVYTESDDERGIDVGLIFRKDIVEILNFRSIVPETSDGRYTSRPVLYVKAETGGLPIHLLLNHWPSRRGGVMAGQGVRENLARLVRHVSDSLITAEGPGTAIIIAGDFNCDPSDRAMQILSGGSLVNLSAGLKPGTGTYRYRGVWQVFDQIIVSAALTEGGSSLSAGGVLIHSPEFMLADDPVYPGKKPFSTYDGFRYSGGFSDHLPVKVEVRY